MSGKKKRAFRKNTKFGKKRKANVKCEENSEESPIARLDDDCLINIFNYLSPEDHILILEKGN